MSKKNTYRLLSILLLLCLHGKAFGQRLDLGFDFSNGDTFEVQLCRTDDVVTFSGPQFLNTSHETYDAWAIVRANGIMQITVDNAMSAMSGGKYITVRNANGLLDSSTNSAITVLQDINTPVLIHIHIDSNKMVPGTSTIVARMTSDHCLSEIPNIVTHNMDGDSIIVDYMSYDSAVLINLNDGPWRQLVFDSWPNGSTILHGVECHRYNTITFASVIDSSNHCCRYNYTFFPTTCSSAHGCIKATDLNADYVSCIASGSFSLVPGRHTVMHDTTLYDPQIEWLRTVCEGCDSTVRLGNSNAGAEWEAINYAVNIDTMSNAILILKYAAVLQNPDHVPSNQPRFSFDLLDLSMQPVGSACAHADFIASDSMGWAQYNYIMWKDWTTVGFDLSEFHGQTLNLYFKTRDCAQGGHFGYAYFTTQCATRQIIAQECGIVDTNTFTAPEGFNYQWTDSLGNTISTSRTITVPSDGGIYHCQITSTEDAACSFTLGTYAGVRLPKAAGSVEQVHTNDCRNYDVSFKSESFVTSDGINPVPYGYRCDEETWYFGDGTSATGFNPTHSYADTGTYEVMIIASLCDGQCVDTGYLTIHLTPIQIEQEVRINACDSLRWRDGVLYTADTLGPTLLITGPTHCDSLLTLNLRINHTSHNSLLFDTICYGQSILWQSTLINDTSLPDQILHLILRDTLRTVQGCDSSVGLNLLRWPKTDFSVNATAHCEDYFYTLSVNYTADSLLLFMQDDTGAVMLRQDDTLSFTVDSATAYLFTAGYTDSLFCMADTTLILRPISILKAALKLTPEKLTYENLTLHAYDITGGEHSRSWSIVHADGDSVRLTENEAYLVYNADVDDDSTRVVLAVDNGVCLDTATGCIYLVRADFFAPNVFTPGLADNNRFVIPGIGIRPLSLSIFNRMGLLVFSTDHPEEGWDGTHEGVPCMQGAYVWHLTYTSDITPERIQTAVGTVTLVR